MSAVGSTVVRLNSGAGAGFGFGSLSTSSGPSARDEPTAQVIQAGEADEDVDDFTVTDAQPKEEMDVVRAAWGRQSMQSAWSS
jgi:hypothetical protein